MRKYLLKIILILSLLPFVGANAVYPEEGKLFTAAGSKEEFARDVAPLIERAWRKWQDGVVIEEVYVEGSQGILLPGKMKGPVMTKKRVMAEFDRKGKSQNYIDCVHAVAESLENGMRKWQKGYSHQNIPFPQGASCVYTLTPCQNVPVAVSTGSSTGSAYMKEDSLYNFMLYRVPYYEEDVLVVLRGTAFAIFECFTKWKESCYIDGITAEGGVAPGPAPMGQGPGLVQGAKGKGGKLSGAYLDGERMYELMCKYFREREAQDRSAISN